MKKRIEFCEHWIFKHFTTITLCCSNSNFSINLPPVCCRPLLHQFPRAPSYFVCLCSVTSKIPYQFSDFQPIFTNYLCARRACYSVRIFSTRQMFCFFQMCEGKSCLPRTNFWLQLWRWNPQWCLCNVLTYFLKKSLCRKLDITLVKISAPFKKRKK